LTGTAELTLEITDLASGGDGVAREASGRVVFVPATAVGDVVTVALVQQRRQWARGRVVEVVRPSPSRVAPGCEYFVEGSCGGCQWQHLSRDAQVAAKQALVGSALRKAVAAGLEVRPILTPAPAKGWRRRARLHVKGGVAGFYAPRSHQLTRIDRCEQLDPRLQALLPALQAAQLPEGELHLLIGMDGAIAVATTRAWPGAAHLLGGTVVSVQAGSTRLGAPHIEVEPGLFVDAAGFAQAGEAGNAELTRQLLAALPATPGRLLELFAGGGNFTRHLVGCGWRVTASDIAPPATPVAGTTFISGAAVDVVGGLSAERFDAVVLDPPRTGAAEVVGALSPKLARDLVYVSCDPASLARDLELLVARGFRPVWAQPLDLMPDTSHLEVVVRMVAADFAANSP
jgi:23S rRNA (uracil1939-C5)-methyltransferase